MDLDKLLTALFDFQRFECDPALQSVIQDAEERYLCEELSDDTISMVAAAGDPYSQLPGPGGKVEPL